MFISMVTTYIKRRNQKLLSKNSLFVFLVCSFLYNIKYLFFYNSCKTKNVTNVVIIFSTSALFLHFIAYIFFKEQIRKKCFISTVLYLQDYV